MSDSSEVIALLAPFFGLPGDVVAVGQEHRNDHGGVVECTWSHVFCGKEAIVFVNGDPYCQTHAEELAALYQTRTDEQAENERRRRELIQAQSFSWRSLLICPANVNDADMSALDALEELLPLKDHMPWDGLESCALSIDKWLENAVLKSLIKPVEFLRLAQVLEDAGYRW